MSNVWDKLEPGGRDTIGDVVVMFDKRTLEYLRKIDPSGKHLKAIRQGRVGPRGQAGLVSSEVAGYILKTKVKGTGGATRFHARLLDDGTLCFENITRHSGGNG